MARLPEKCIFIDEYLLRPLGDAVCQQRPSTTGTSDSISPRWSRAAKEMLAVNKREASAVYGAPLTSVPGSAGNGRGWAQLDAGERGQVDGGGASPGFNTCRYF